MFRQHLVAALTRPQIIVVWNPADLIEVQVLQVSDLLVLDLLAPVIDLHASHSVAY